MVSKAREIVTAAKALIDENEDLLVAWEAMAAEERQLYGNNFRRYVADTRASDIEYFNDGR